MRIAELESSIRAAIELHIAGIREDGIGVLKVVRALGYRLTLVEKAAARRAPRGAALPPGVAKARRPPEKR